MRLTPTTPREIGIDYVSQWRDRIIYLDENDQIDWVDSSYPYSRADLRAVDVKETGLPAQVLLSEDGFTLVSEDGNILITG